MNIFGLTLSYSDLWLLGVAGSLFAILINYWLSKTQSRIARLASASTKFRSDVLSCLSGLYPIASDWTINNRNIDDRLRSVFPKLQIAVEEFKPFLPWYKRIYFNIAWFRFHNAYGRKQDSQCYHHYMDFGSNPNAKEYFKHNIDKILGFAGQR